MFSDFLQVLSDTRAQDKKFRQTKYRHGLYEYALLHAAQDALRSTQLLPYHAKTWLRAGDALAELRKLKESSMYYQKAIELDPTLKDRLEPVIDKLERSQEFLDKAKGWVSSDTLRLALDVAG
jgi:tetratricopeptide (TPR) repeat protein